MLRLHLFGRPHLRGLDAAHARAGQRQRLALLALLAHGRSAGVSRDRLIALLWPEADDARGRHLLSNSVYILRQALGGDVITAEADALRLDAARLPSDLEDFLAALEGGDDQAALPCCEAPFMEGFFLPGAEEFERWLETERDRLARARAGACERLAERAEAAGDLRGAAEHWQRLAECDPYTSRIALRYMQVLARAGEPAAAIRHAREHERRLRDDLGAEPAAEVRELAARLAAQGAGVENGHRTDAYRTDAYRTDPHPADARPADPAPAAGPRAGPRPLEPAASVPRAGRRRVRVPQRTLVLSLLPLLLVMLALHQRAPSRAADPVRSVAVLPFVDLDGGEAYFSDGLTEELINRLAQVEGLRVAARTSAFSFKDVNADIGEIGRRLNVELVLEGSVRRTGDRVRITAQLVNVADGYHLWSRTYEHSELRDIFRIQDEISRQIVTSLLPRFARVDLPGSGTEDVQAFEAYLKGRYAFWQARSSGDLDIAIAHFRAALARDPRYALAYAGLADAYMLRGGPPGENLPRAKDAALQALALDDELSEGYVALASINWFYDWDWEAAARNYRRSFSVNRVIYTRCICYVWYLAVLEDFEGAIREARRARALDPVALVPLTTLANAYLVAGRHGEARALLPELRSAGADELTTAPLEAWLEWREGRPGEAAAVLDRLRAGRDLEAFLDAAGPWTGTGAAIIYAGAGRTSEAQGITRALEQRATRGYVSPMLLAAGRAATGDTAAAAAWIRAAHAERANLAYFSITPAAEPLRDLPAFREVLAAVRPH